VFKVLELKCAGYSLQNPPSPVICETAEEVIFWNAAAHRYKNALTKIARYFYFNIRVYI
jgi:hypothetical protein